MLDWLFNLAFTMAYGGFILVIALLAAIPYGIWQGIKRIGARFSGGKTDGNS